MAPRPAQMVLATMAQLRSLRRDDEVHWSCAAGATKGWENDGFHGFMIFYGI